MEADVEADLFNSAQRLALDPEMLGLEGGEADPDTRGRQLRSATLLAGLLWNASTPLIDELFNDVEELRAAAEPSDWAEVVANSSVLSGLPARFHRKVTPVVAAKFLVVAVDLTARLSQGWRPPSCVAQELMLRFLLDQVEALIDLYEVTDVDVDWRAGVEDVLFEDLDHELLYEAALDGFEEDEDFPGPPGMAPMDFERWFVPFNASRRLPPYAEDEADRSTL
jgi:hypothetical protein